MEGPPLAGRASLLIGDFLLYREVALRVPSALMSLTSVFGIHKYALIWHIYAENLAR